MLPRCPPILAVIPAAYAVWAASVADAKPAPRPVLECVSVTADFVTVDGLVEDWDEIEGRTFAARGADASYQVRCAQAGPHVFFAVHVRDDAVVRTGASGRGQDHLVVRIGPDRATAVSTLEVFPGTRGFAPVHRWRGKNVAAPARVADSLQADGWSFEAMLPVTQLSGWGRGTPALRTTIALHDADGAGDGSVVEARGTLSLVGGTEVYEGFLRAAQLSPARVRLDLLVDIDGAPGVERVIVGDRVIGVLSDEYRYIVLPVERASDVIDVRVVDLAGAGKVSVLAQYRQHGNGGSRDVVGVWNLRPMGELARTLAIEVRKQLDDRLLVNDWELVRKIGKRKGRRTGKSRRGGDGAGTGFDLVVRVGEVQGWDEASWAEWPAEDARPILTPWGDRQSAVFHFEEDSSFGGESADP
jgi:hypothetical protein